MGLRKIRAGHLCEASVNDGEAPVEVRRQAALSHPARPFRRVQRSRPALYSFYEGIAWSASAPAGTPACNFNFGLCARVCEYGVWAAPVRLVFEL